MTANLTGWFSPAQAGQILGITPQRVRQLVRAGRIACITTPLGRLLDPASVHALLAKRRRQQAGRKSQGRGQGNAVATSRS